MIILHFPISHFQNQKDQIEFVYENKFYEDFSKISMIILLGATLIIL